MLPARGIERGSAGGGAAVVAAVEAGTREEDHNTALWWRFLQIGGRFKLLMVLGAP